MRGIRGISKELDTLIESLPSSQLHAVLELAFALARDDFPDDPVIAGDVERFCLGGQLLDQEFARELAQKSKEADERYTSLEEAGYDRATYEVDCCKARVLYALSLVFGTNEITLALVDKVIYELGHGAKNI